jgi:uncharacterized protein involved in exopolysaccharide biosynthesis
MPNTLMETSPNYVRVTRRQPDVEDYIEMLRRHRSWVIGPAFAGLVITVAVACWLPDTFESRAVLRIMPQSVPATMVPAAVIGQMQTRLEQMQVEILGRPHLMALIQQPTLDLYKKERAHRPLDDVAEDMRLKDIRVIPYDPGTARNRGAQAFVISFRYPDKFKAQMVVRELTTSFQDTNFRLQANQANITANFVGDELKKAKERMEAKQQELTQFVTENQGRLPENYQANTMALGTFQHDLQANEDQIGRDQVIKSTYESDLANTRLLLEGARANLQRVEVTPGAASVRNTTLINLNNDIHTLEQQLEEYLRRYKPSMPEVVTAQAKLAKLKEDRDRLQAEEEAAAAGSPGATTRLVSNPAAEQQVRTLETNERRIKANMDFVTQEITALTRRAETLRKNVADAGTRIASSPVVVQKYNNLTEAVALAKEEFNAESRRKDQSDSMQNLEEHKAGENLEVLESANLPETSSDPNRPAIVGIGTFLGLFVGFAMAGAKELKNTSLKNLKDVRAYTNLPILSSIPLLENALLVRRKRRLAWLAWASAVVVGIVLMCGAAYYRYSGSVGPS